MTEAWRPKGEEGQIYENKRAISHADREKPGNILKTVRQKSLMTFAVHTSCWLSNCGASSADVRYFMTLS